MLVLTFPNDGGHADLGREGANLLSDDGLEAAVVIALFTDARVASDSGQPQRGWWADQFFELPIGSELWTLRREGDMASTLRRAEELTTKALAWLVELGVARAVTIVAERLAAGVLGITVDVERGDGRRWRRVWEARSNAL